MKSFYFLALLVLLGLYQEAQATSTDNMASYKSQQKDCIKELNIGDADAKQLIDNYGIDIKNPTKDVKCFYNCIHKKMGLLGADGKPNYEAIFKILKAMYNSIPVEKLQQQLKSCGEVASQFTNECDAIYNFEMCFQKGLKM